MSEVTWDDATKQSYQQNNVSNSNNANKVEFFSINNDGETAFVRFMCDSTSDFEILAVHDVKVGAKNRKLNCLRNPKEEINKCPACAHAINEISAVKTKVYIKLIHYVPDTATGKLIPKAKVWERSVAYAQKIADLFKLYPHLSECVVAITRHGKKNDTKTDYNINVLQNHPVYNNETCPVIPEAFNGYRALGRIVLDKNYDEMTTFFQTGAFPAKESAYNQQNTVSATPAFNPVEITPRTAPTAPQDFSTNSLSGALTEELPF